MKIKFLFLVFILSSSISLWALEHENNLETLEKKVKVERQILNSKSLAIKQQLALMVDLDQEIRDLIIKDVNNRKTHKLLEEIDHFHTNHLKSMVKEYDWVTILKFDEEMAHQAWLLVQHADHDPDFQTSFMSALEKLCPLNETYRKNYAYIYDRIASNRGLKQRYGTQVKVEGNQVELLPYEGSLNDLNKRRREIGLESIQEYLKTLKKYYVKSEIVPACS
ncbi:MAG: hypothetical protein K2Y08_01945 [Alphaproteobacteria bacterium]|nr:hypothetical protein [Alphaproteobacteria bacterium]